MHPTRRALLAWRLLPAGIVCLAWAVYVARYWRHWDRFVGGTHDETLWLALALRWTDPALFPRDPFVAAVMPTFPTAYAALMGTLLRAWPDPGTVLLIASSALLLIYAAGVYRLVVDLVGHRPTAVLVALAAFRVSFDLAGTGWGIFVGNAPPRAFVFAAVPWLLAWFLRTAHSPRRLAGLGVVLGLLGDVHPLSVLHVALMLGGALLLEGSLRARLARVAALAAGVTAGILPYLVQWSRVRDVTPLAIEIVRFRAEPQSFPSWDTVGTVLLTAYLPPALLALGGLWVGRRAATGWIVRLLAVVAVASAAGPLLTLAWPRLFAIHLLRMSSYAFLLLLVLAAYLLAHALTRHTLAGTAAGAALAAFLVLTAGGTRIADLGPRLAASHGSVGAPLAAADTLPATSGVPDPGDRESFLDLCRWAAAGTATDALFLSPPGPWASFRIYARRGLYTTFKDGAVTVFSGARAREWFSRERTTERLYAPAHRSELPAFAAAHGIGYVIETRAESRLELPVAFENRAFRVYRVAAG